MKRVDIHRHCSVGPLLSLFKSGCLVFVKSQTTRFEKRQEPWAGGSEAGAWATAPLPRGRVRDPTPGPRLTGTSPDYRGEVVLSEVGSYPALTAGAIF
jgi:hypothetical protein